MLSDRRRTLAYRDALQRCGALIEGKVVLDVGCGTGILSLFAAQAGASRVYAVDASHMAEVAQQIVECNRMQDRIKVIHSRVEDAQLPEKVDVIVSEWMGYALLYEGMLASVLLARDRWLKPGGLMLPSVAHIYAVPFSSSADEDSDDDGDGDGSDDGGAITAAVACKHGEFTWEDVYGFDMSAMAEYERHASRCRDAEILPLAAHHQMALRSSLLHTIDCHTISIEQCKEFHARFSCQFIVSEQLAGLALWFEVVFHPSGIVLSTSPDLEPTHWCQTLLRLPEPIEVAQDESLTFELAVSVPRDNARALDLALTIDDKLPLVAGKQKTVRYRLR